MSHTPVHSHSYTEGRSTTQGANFPGTANLLIGEQPLYILSYSHHSYPTNINVRFRRSYGHLETTLKWAFRPWKQRRPNYRPVKKERQNPREEETNCYRTLENLECKKETRTSGMSPIPELSTTTKHPSPPKEKHHQDNISKSRYRMNRDKFIWYPYRYNHVCLL